MPRRPDDRLEHRRSDIRRRPGRRARLLHREARLRGSAAKCASVRTARTAGWTWPPPGSRARVALNPPMGDEPGDVAIGVGTADAVGEHKSLSAIGGTDPHPEPRRTPRAPLPSRLRGPD